MNEIYNFFLEAYSNSPTYIIVLEFLAFIFGIISVVYAKKENITNFEKIQSKILPFSYQILPRTS